MVAFEAERVIALRSTQGPFTATYRYELRPTDAGDAATIVTLKADCVATGLVNIIAPLIRYLIRRTDGKQLADLKKSVERS